MSSARPGKRFFGLSVEHMAGGGHGELRGYLTLSTAALDAASAQAEWQVAGAESKQTRC